MAKNTSNDMVQTVLTILGVGAGAFIVYKLLSPAPVSAPMPAAAPMVPTARTQAPVAQNTAPVPLALQRGPAYWKWSQAIAQANQDFLSGKISLPVLRDQYAQMKNGISQDYMNNQLTFEDANDLNSDINSNS